MINHLETIFYFGTIVGPFGTILELFGTILGDSLNRRRDPDYPCLWLFPKLGALFGSP